MALLAQAWILLKYRPACYWFEVPFLAYKCVVIAAGELLDSGSAEDTKLLLMILTASAGGMLVFVVVSKPFRDKEDGQKGFSGADKAEIIALVSMLVNLCVGWMCWLIKEERSLGNWEELAVNIIGLLCVCAPLVFMASEWSKSKRRQQQNAINESSTLAELEDGDQAQGGAALEEQQPKKKKKAEKKTDGQVVAFDNPVLDD